jgi:ERCC4-type nuclease
MDDITLSIKLPEVFNRRKDLLKNLDLQNISYDFTIKESTVIEITKDAGIFLFNHDNFYNHELIELIEQYEEFTKKYKKQILIVEGWVKLISNADSKTLNLIIGLELYLAQRYHKGVIPTRSDSDLVLVIKSMAKREQIEDKPPTLARIKPKFATIFDAQKFIIEGLINTGPKKAEILINNLNTPFNIINNIIDDEDKVLSINGFGREFIKDNKILLLKNFNAISKANYESN